MASSSSFDEIEAIHVGSTTLANDKGAAQALAMIETQAARPPSPSIRIAGPTWSGTRRVTLIR
jgi:hypothetical protein